MLIPTSLLSLFYFRILTHGMMTSTFSVAHSFLVKIVCKCPYTHHRTTYLPDSFSCNCIQSCNGPSLSACFLHPIYWIVSRIVSSRLSTFRHKLVDINDWWAFDCYWTLFISDFESSFHFLSLLRPYSFCLLKKSQILWWFFCTVSISPLLIFALNFAFNNWCSLSHLFVLSAS